MRYSLGSFSQFSRYFFSIVSGQGLCWYGLMPTAPSCPSLPLYTTPDTILSGLCCSPITTGVLVGKQSTKVNSLPTVGQTVEKPQELSGKICPREVPRSCDWESLITRGTSHGKISKAFPLLVRLKASKTEENVSHRSCLNTFRISKK